MTIRDFALLVDENIDSEVTSFLRSSGFDVREVCGTELTGATDLELIRLSVEQNRVIVTHDRDFGRIAIAAGEPIVGIFFLRPGHINPAFTIESFGTVLSRQMSLRAPFILVADRHESKVNIRLRLL